MAIYTSSNPYTTSWTFDNLIAGDLSFTSIVATEADWGYYLSFTDTAPDPIAYAGPGVTGMSWDGFEAGVTGANASMTTTITYDVAVTNPNEYLTSLQQLYLVDALIGPGASATATEKAYDSAGDLVASTTWVGGSTNSSSAVLGAGYQQLSIVLTVNLSIDSTGLPTSVADISSIQQNFGETSLSNMAVIGDNVFLDTTGTGIQTGVDAGPPVAGVTVDLLAVNGSSVTQVATTKTDANGDYQFVVLPGTYEVQFVAPSGYAFSPQNASSNPDLSSSPNPATGITAPLVVTAGEVDNAVDAGLYMPAAFDVHVYYDANDNAIQDTGDTNLSGLTVTLLNGNGTPTGQTAVTDSNGNVSFTGLQPGSYEVAVTTPSGDIVTQNSNVTVPNTLLSGQTAYAVEGLFSATPSLSVVKTVTGITDTNHDGRTDAGDIINYNIQVSNTGNETLTGVTVVDPLTGGTIASNVTLAIGQQVNYTTSYTVTQANVDNDGNAIGSQLYVSNMTLANGYEMVTFTGSSSWSGGTEYAGQMDLTVNYGSTDIPSGQFNTYAWCVDVKHDINLGANNIVYTLQQLNVANAGQIAALAAWGDAQLAAGPNALISAAVQSDIWMLEYNVGLASGTNAALVNEIAYINGTVLPGLMANNAGLEVTGIANGLVTTQSLYLSQAPGQGDITNTVTVTSNQTGPASSTVQTPISYAPGLELVKTITGVMDNNSSGIVTAGSVIDYNVEAINTGDVTLTGVTIVDPLTGATLAAGATIAVGGTVTYATSYTISATDAANDGNPAGSGDIVNTATATSNQTGPQTASATEAIVAPVTKLSIVKEVSLNNGKTWSAAPVDPTELASGAKPEYEFIVTNGGNVLLTSVAVTDSLYGTIGTIGSLAAGATTTLTATESWASGQVTDTATAKGTYTPTVGSASSVVSNTATAEYVGAAPALTIVKEVSLNNGATWSTAPADPTELASGAKPEYEFIVTNSGNVALSNVGVVDSLYGTIGSIGSIAAGATATLTATETWASGQVTDTATASTSYTDSEGNTATVVSNTATAEYIGVTPTIALQKLISLDGGSTWASAPSAITAPFDNSGGPAPEYEFIVTNAGTVALSNVTLTDTVTSGGAVNLGSAGNIGNLAAGASDTIVATGSFAVGLNSDTGTGTGTYTDSVGNTATVSSSATANYLGVQSTGSIGNTGTPGLTVIKLPSQVVVGTCGQVTYTFDVINTGSTALTNVQISDNIGTAANPDYITPVLQTQTTNGVLLPGQTWVYAATINESGDYTSKGGSQSCGISGQNLSGGCTAWLNSSFTPTSCKNGATYNFQNITCTVKGPNCGTITLQVPNACVTFSSSCTQPTTTFNASENCWITTLPANSNPGNVFLSGIPCEVPSGCNLSGATCTWSIGQSANNCGSPNISWQTGCTGYSSFNVNNCNGQADYNQIGVKVCDNSSGYGCGGNTNQGYGWNYSGSNNYCGGQSGGGGWSGAGGDWIGSGNDCAGTPENLYCGSNCGGGSSGGNGCGGSNGGFGGGYGCGGDGYGGGYGYGGGCGNGGGTCGNGGGSGSISCGQLGDSSQADTVSVTAATVGAGFSLGDAGNYGIIAFGPSTFKASSSSPITGNVGLGSLQSCGGSSTSVQLAGDKITGNLVVTGSKPTTTGGTVTGTISGSSSTLAADISTLQTLSQTLAAETGTTEKLTSGMTLQATAGTLDSSGDEVFAITQWANNITINGSGANAVVLNIACGVNISLDNLTLTGGLTADEVLINDQNTGTISAVSGDRFNGTVLAPNAVFNVAGSVAVNGHLYGGATNQTFAFTGGATLTTPSNTGSITTATTLTATDSTEVQVLSGSSPITVNGTAPSGSLSTLYGTAEKLEFQYSPSDTVSLKQIQAGLASESGNNTSSMAFIEMTNNSNPYASNATIYFEGEVQSGEKIFADATLNELTNTAIAAPNNHFSTTSGADLYMYVFTSQTAFESGAAPIQTMTYNTSGSQAMHLGDQIGSLTLVGYVGTTGGHLVS